MNKLYEEFVAAKDLEPRPRGKEFEKIIGLMFSNENLRHSLSYRPEGEEIDGAFIWNTHTFLVEAKWHKEPMPASAIYAFKGKVDGKFSGTRGIFISMSGFSEDCQKAVAQGKELNILLFDRDDIEDIVGSQVNDGVNFTKVLTEKLFAASQTGKIYLTWRNLQQSQKTDSKSLLIGCYSPDEVVLKSLLRYVSDQDHLITDQADIFSIQGSIEGSSTLSLIQLRLANASDSGVVLMIASADRVDDENKRILSDPQQHMLLPPSWSYHSIIVSPNIFSWIDQIGISGTQQILTMKDGQPILDLQLLNLVGRAVEAAKHVDWGVLATKNKDVREALSFIRGMLSHQLGYA